eukprot:TRINITY_DN19154_c1_g4_i1.p1 TRINITY_DN19154_c1_g4~~TRINITY_DN19154_c1_g4_i1.p1  ORF type:complete len:731 (-),score=175.21 TRINITY_DN19154_c1_g4_i1:75-2027(-)
MPGATTSAIASAATGVAGSSTSEQLAELMAWAQAPRNSSFLDMSASSALGGPMHASVEEPAGAEAMFGTGSPPGSLQGAGVSFDAAAVAATSKADDADAAGSSHIHSSGLVMSPPAQQPGPASSPDGRTEASGLSPVPAMASSADSAASKDGSILEAATGSPAGWPGQATEKPALLGGASGALSASLVDSGRSSEQPLPARSAREDSAEASRVVSQPAAVPNEDPAADVVQPLPSDVSFGVSISSPTRAAGGTLGVASPTLDGSADKPLVAAAAGQPSATGMSATSAILEEEPSSVPAHSPGELLESPLNKLDQSSELDMDAWIPLSARERVSARPGSHQVSPAASEVVEQHSPAAASLPVQPGFAHSAPVAKAAALPPQQSEEDDDVTFSFTPWGAPREKAAAPASGGRFGLESMSAEGVEIGGHGDSRSQASPKARAAAGQASPRQRIGVLGGTASVAQRNKLLGAGLSDDSEDDILKQSLEPPSETGSASISFGKSAFSPKHKANPLARKTNTPGNRSPGLFQDDRGAKPKAAAAGHSGMGAGGGGGRDNVTEAAAPKAKAKANPAPGRAALPFGDDDEFADDDSEDEFGFPKATMGSPEKPKGGMTGGLRVGGLSGLRLGGGAGRGRGPSALGGPIDWSQANDPRW